MATVTVLTAERMLEIEAESIVSGTVNGFGHLILTNHGGDTFDAGLVLAPNLADASTTVKGIVELTTSAEAITGTDTTRAVTPQSLADQFANAFPIALGAAITDPTYVGTTAQPGFLELATSAETITGTDNSRAVKPQGLTARINDQFQLGTIQIFSTGLAPVLLDDGITTVNCNFDPGNPDVKPGALVAVQRDHSGNWFIVTVYDVTPTYPKWVDLVLATGWTYKNNIISAGTISNGGVPDAPYHKVQVTKTAGNYVDVAGAISQGASASNLITTLPIGYRPLVEHYFLVAGITAAGALTSTGVKVLPDGTVTLQNLGTTGSQWFLDGINFTNDASLVWTSLSSIGYLNSWADTGGTAPVGAVTVDSNFRVFLRGKVKRTSAGAGLNQMTNVLGSTFRIDNAAGSAGNILRGNDPGVRVARFDIIGAGSLQDTGGGFTDTALDLVSSWMSQNYPGSWTSPTFFTGSDYGSSYPVRAYTKTPDQMVMFRGMIASSTGGKSVQNLPEGYRPSGVRGFPIFTANAIGLYLVFPDGAVYFNSGNTWEELNQIRFVAEK